MFVVKVLWKNLTCPHNVIQIRKFIWIDTEILSFVYLFIYKIFIYVKKSFTKIVENRLK